MNKLRLSTSFIILIISIMVCLFLYPEDKFSIIDSVLVQACTYLVLVNCIVFLRTVTIFVKTWVRFDFFFLLSYVIVHFQTVFLWVVFKIEPIKLSFWTNKLTVNYGIWLSTIVILLWMLGFYFSLFKNLKKIKKTSNKQNDFEVKYSPYFDYMILAFFIVFAVLVGSAFWGGRYLGTSNWGAGATYVFLVLRTLITLRIIYFFVNYKNRLKTIRQLFFSFIKNKILFISVLIYIFIFLIQGDRGPILQLGLLIIAGYSIFNVNISFSKIFVATVSGALLFTVIGLGRSSEVQYDDSGIFSKGIENLNASENLIPTEELAWSGGILYKAIDINPNGDAYLKGLTIFNNIIGIIPFSTLVYNPSKMMRSSSQYFTYMYKGPDAKFGVGSEVIADVYINLGFWATLILFFLFGYYISYLTLQTHLYQNNFYAILCYMIFITLSIYLNRSFFLNPLKYMFYLCVFHFFFGKIIKWKQKKSHS